MAKLDGFEEVDYEGHPMLVCQQPKCDFNTFDAEAAKGHADWHAAQEAAAGQRAELEKVAEPDYGPDPEPPKPKRKPKEAG